jgi:hypothetical protein
VNEFKRYNKPVNDKKNYRYKAKALAEFKNYWKDKLAYDVYDNEQFKQHLIEVSKSLNIDIDVIEKVIKLFLETYLKFMDGFMDVVYKKFDFKYFILIIKRGENFNSLFKENYDKEEEK